MTEKDSQKEKEILSEDAGIRISTSGRKHYERSLGLKILGICLGLILFSSILSYLFIRSFLQKELGIQSRNGQVALDQIYQHSQAEIYNRENFKRIYQNSSPFLVGVATNKEDLLKRAIGKTTTGLRMDSNGTILAPSSSLADTGAYFVRFADKNKENILPATLIARDANSELLLLSVKGAPTEEVPFRQEPVSIMDTVMPIGKPTGVVDEGNALMSFVHSAPRYYSISGANSISKVLAYTVDVPMYYGVDGAVVFDMKGNISGLLSDRLTKQLSMPGYSAVIPVTELKRLTNQLKNKENTANFPLGIEGRFTAIPGSDLSGFYVLNVEADSSAQRAGIQPTDLILTMDGIKLTADMKPDDILKNKTSGERVIVSVQREGKVQSLTVALY